MPVKKPLEFLGTSLRDLKAFSASARREAGYQLDLVQDGLEPADWKPFKSVGPGVREIRIAEQDGAFRVMYVASFADAVYVLHCFVKKTQQTALGDVRLAKKRFDDLIRRKS